MGCSFLSLSFFSLFTSLLLTCVAEDRITLGKSIFANQTITSSGENFALGFFTPLNSTNSYLGIWYNKIPDQTIVWIANREKPVIDSSGVLAIADDGNLVVLDRNRNVLWSSNIPNKIVVTQNNPIAILLDSGNFILRHDDKNQTVLWESFDNPTDTFIPGMKISSNLKTGKTIRLTAWKDAQNPSPGDCSCGIDPQRPLQLLIWRRTEPYWRSGVWTGKMYRGEPQRDRNYVVLLTVVANDEEIYLTFSLSEDSVISRIVLDQGGKIRMLSWQDNIKRWFLSWSIPSQTCEFYNPCGPFGMCDPSKSSSMCKCLLGFEPKVKEDWDMGVWSGGCVRKKKLECEKGDGFLRLPLMKLPDLFISLGDMSTTECEAKCLGNCSCTAYASANVSQGVNSRCLIWVGELVDICENYESGLDLYVRLASSELGANSSRTNDISNRKRRSLIIILSMVALAILLLGISTYFLWRRLRKQERRKASMAFSLPNLGTSKRLSTNGSGTKNTPELPLLSFSSIKGATDNFSNENKLGEGGFGPVYKGKFSEDQEIAVKRLSKISGQGLEEFKNEVELIAKLQHKNLVRLLGWCIHGKEKILIYEFMPNKSLDKFLFDPAQQAVLDWGKRFHIIEGIAQGLLYLHKYSRLKIIHRDLKASNILLDGSMNPKISDFGLARIFGGNQTEANTNRVVGTYGYMSPEYAMDGLFSEKSDVFSFGVLLLEIVTGKKNTGFYPSKNSLNLLGYAWQLWKEGKALRLMDQSISSSCVERDMLKCMHVGFLCVQEDAADRPTMSSVVSMLGNETATLPSPKQPAFFTGRRTTTVDTSSNVSTNHSINEVTITTMEAR